MLPTQEIAKSKTKIESEIESSLFGIIPKPGETLEDIRYKWSKRTKDSYQRIPIFANIEQTIWRCARNGKSSRWDAKKMIANNTKHNSLVIEHYVSMDILPLVDQQRLALEQISLWRKQAVSACHKKSLDKAIASINELVAEIELFPGNIEADILVELQKALPVLTQSFGNIPCFQELSELIDSIRFKKIDHLLRCGEWVENCLLIQEMSEKKLFRFTHNSFESYCRSAGIKDGTKRIKIAKVIDNIVFHGLKLPSNRQQAYSISQIPTENQVRVWEQALASGKKITGGLINEVHQTLVGRSPTKQEIKSNSLQTINKINTILQKYPEMEIGESATCFWEYIQSAKNISTIEIRLLQALHSGLQAQLRYQ